MEESIKYPSIVFNIAELHQKYWKEFCDAYYSSFGFVTSENSTYEQKYETFCRLKEWSEKGKGYKEEHLEVNSFDFRFLKKLEERLYSLKDKEELISTLYYYVRTIRSIRRKIGIKNWTIKIFVQTLYILKIIPNIFLMRQNILKAKMNTGQPSETF